MFFCETSDLRPTSTGILTFPRAYNCLRVPCSITYLRFVLRVFRAEIVMCPLNAISFGADQILYSQ